MRWWVCGIFGRRVLLRRDHGIELMKVDIPLDDNPVEVQNAGWTHAIPFIAWMVLMMGFEHTPAVGYLVRTLAGLALLLYCAPWRWYPRIRLRNIPVAAGVGLALARR